MGVGDGSSREPRRGLGLARLIKIWVNRSVYNRKTIIDMKIKKSVIFLRWMFYLLIQLKSMRNCLVLCFV